MNAPNLHLNLLRAEEKASSSPVRMRVMLPILAFLLCAACAVWWAILLMQLMMLNSKVVSLRSELEGKKSAHAAILEKMANARELQAELDQLQAYRNGCRTYGNLLAHLAEVVPAEVQLTSLSIPEPPPQMLSNPKMPKLPPLLGPTNTTEAVSLRITGRTAAAASVTKLMESFEDGKFKEWIVINKNKKDPAALQSPRVRSFRQETRKGDDGPRLLAFDVEYRCAERRFEK